MSDRKLEVQGRADPSWKTADELKITPAELVALITVRDMLIKGEIGFAPFTPARKERLFRKARPFSYALPKEKSLNMRCFSYKAQCGTVHCVGGWMHFIMTGDHNSAGYVKHGRSAALRPLFFPPGDYEEFKQDQCALAIENFLCSGTPKWGSRPHP